MSNNLSFVFSTPKIQGDSERIFGTGAEGNIGTEIFPRREAKKAPEGLEYLRDKPKTQVNMKIALLGRPGAGKDTFVRLFQKAYPHISCQIIRLAEPLYEVQDFVYKICDKKIEKGAQDGVLLNFLGKHMRSINPDVLLSRFASVLKNGRFILCSDARPIDLPFLKQLGFTIVHIATDPTIAKQRREIRGDLSLGNSHHETEGVISPEMYDFQIQNNQSLEEFEKAIKSLFIL